jgi:nucleoside phosphorylase
MPGHNVTEKDFTTAREITEPTGPIVSDLQTAEVLVEDARDQIYSRLRVAVLNAVTHEYAAVLAVFGEEQSIPSREHVLSPITYVTIRRPDGRINYIVLAGISGQGIAQAAAMASLIKYKCRHVTKIILVGIAAGQPNLSDGERDVRLGDIVVGNNIIQYDHVKRTDGKIDLRGDKLPTADSDLINLANRLRASQEFAENVDRLKPWQRYIDENVLKIRKAARPKAEQDKNYPQRNYTVGTEYERSDNYPYVHFGTIGSAGTLLKDSKYRDNLNLKYKTIAYEMEGAGVAIASATNGFGYLIVRGICDYADSDKNDQWQTYASVCAASFARCILEAL